MGIMLEPSCHMLKVNQNSKKLGMWTSYIRRKEEDRVVSYFLKEQGEIAQQ